MRKKSVREMSKVERFHYSLEARMFQSIARYTIILGLVCFILGLGMYMEVLMEDSVRETYAVFDARRKAADARAADDADLKALEQSIGSRKK